VDFAATVIDLAHRAGLPLLTQLAVLFGLAVVVYVFGKLGLKLPAYTPEPPPPPAQWGDNVKPDGGPPGGGMEGG